MSLLYIARVGGYYRIDITSDTDSLSELDVPVLVSWSIGSPGWNLLVSPEAVIIHKSLCSMLERFTVSSDIDHDPVSNITIDSDRIVRDHSKSPGRPPSRMRSYSGSKEEIEDMKYIDMRKCLYDLDGDLLLSNLPDEFVYAYGNAKGIDDLIGLSIIEHLCDMPLVLLISATGCYEKKSFRKYGDPPLLDAIKLYIARGSGRMTAREVAEYLLGRGVIKSIDRSVLVSIGRAASNAGCIRRRGSFDEWFYDNIRLVDPQDNNYIARGSNLSVGRSPKKSIIKSIVDPVTSKNTTVKLSHGDLIELSIKKYFLFGTTSNRMTMDKIISHLKDHHVKVSRSRGDRIIIGSALKKNGAIKKRGSDDQWFYEGIAYVA